MTEKRPAAADDAVRAARFERLMRAYPAWWRARHGEALMGTLLDADVDLQRAGQLRQTTDLVRHGLAVRAATVLPTATCSALSSVALGLGLGFSLADLGVWGWAHFTGWGTLGGAVWFPVAWVLLIAATATERSALRAAAWLLAVTVFLGVPLLHLGPLIVTPWSRTDFPLFALPSRAMTAGVFKVLWEPGLPPAAANNAVQVLLATVSLIGAPRARSTLVTVVATVPAFTFFLTGATYSWVEGFYDSSVWAWPGPGSSAPVGPAAAWIAAALALIAVAASRRHRTIAALAGLGALTLLTGLAVFALADPVFVVYK